MKYTAVGKAAAGSATLPFGGLYSSDANVAIVVREIKVFGSSATVVAARIRIVRATTAGTWTGLTEKQVNKDGAAVTGAAFHTATSTAPTLESGDEDIGAVGASVGSGFHYTYYGEGRGLVIPKGTANGIVLIEEADTANTYDFMFGWDPA